MKIIDLSKEGLNLMSLNTFHIKSIYRHDDPAYGDYCIELTDTNGNPACRIFFEEEEIDLLQSMRFLHEIEYEGK